MKRQRSNRSLRPNKRPAYSYQNRPRQVATYKASSERKYFDTGLNSVLVPNTQTGWLAGNVLDPATTLCCPSLGNDINNRIGKKIQILRVHIKGYIEVVPLTAQSDFSQYPPIRLALVANLQTNGVTVSPTEVFNSAALTGNGAIMSFQNVNFLGKYRVLKDRTFRTSDPGLAVGTVSAGTIETSGTTIPFKMIHKFRKPFHITFNAGTTSTVSDIVSNSLHLIGASVDTLPTIRLSYRCRVTYVDL